MLSCVKVVGYITKFSRHAHAVQLYRPSNDIGLVSITSLRYISTTKCKRAQQKVTGTTAKVEECIPPQRKEAATKAAIPPTGPPCDTRPDGACPPSCYETCGMPPGDGPPPKDPWVEWFKKYWKHIVATIFITGFTYYTIAHRKSDSKTDETKNKKDRKKWRSKIKSPADSSKIPKEVPYLLVGGGTAAFSAFRSIKSRDPKAKVLVVTEESDLPYMRPPLSKELWYNNDQNLTMKLNFKQWNGTTRSLYYEPEEFYANAENLLNSDKGGVAVASGWKVKKIDVENRVAILDDDTEIKYEKCLIATGASPKNIPIFETADEEMKEKILLFRTKQDFLELVDNVNSKDVKNIVIIGGGFLGSELACSLARNIDMKNKTLYQIFKEKHLMAQVLPEYLSEWTTKKVKDEKVHCIPNTEVKDVYMKSGQLSLILTNGQVVEADQVIVAVGVDANTSLAESSNLEVERDIGGYLVNAELEARSNLWIAGDAACFFDVRLGRRRVEHHDHAVVSGRLAGENMTGAGKPYLHQSMFWSDLGPEVGYEAIGIVDSSLPTVGVFAKHSETTPAAAVNTSNDGAKSTSEEQSAQSTNKISLTNTSSVDGDVLKPLENYGKGVIFYLRNDKVVGIVLWNIFNRMSIARQVLLQGIKYDDLNEVAKLFAIHED